MKVISLLGYGLMAGGLVGLIFTHSLFSPAPLVVAIQAAAVLLMLWARVTFGRRSFHATADPTQGELVTSGPYHFVRHPIYTAVVLFCLGGALAHPSLLAGGLVLVVIVGALVRMLLEERFLRERYPEYAAYAARTRRMIPFVF